MELILSLLFMPSLNFDIKPSYKVNHCYSKNEYTVIEITKILKYKYGYDLYIQIDHPIKAWSRTRNLSNNFYSIEHNYEKEVNCP